MNFEQVLNIFLAGKVNNTQAESLKSILDLENPSNETLGQIAGLLNIPKANIEGLLEMTEHEDNSDTNNAFQRYGDICGAICRKLSQNPSIVFSRNLHGDVVLAEPDAPAYVPAEEYSFETKVSGAYDSFDGEE